jgi:RecB family endonuclease NucS
MVIIELKRARSGDRLATQLRRYVDGLLARPEYSGRPVRVMVVASDVDRASMQLLSSLQVPVEVVKYRIGFHRVELPMASRVPAAG